MIGGGYVICMRSGYRSYRVTKVTKDTELQSQQSNRVTGLQK